MRGELRLVTSFLILFCLYAEAALSETNENNDSFDSTSSENDFIFTLVYPRSVEPNKTFTAALALEEADHPVIFNVSLMNGENLLPPSKLITLSCCNIEVISFNVPEIPWEKNDPKNDLENGLKIVVIANYVGAEDGSSSSQHRTFFLSRKSKPSKQILIQTNKDDYTVGEVLNYQIIIAENQIEDYYNGIPQPLEICFLDYNNSPIFNGCKNVLLPSSRVYTGNFIVKKNGIRKIKATLKNKDSIVNEEKLISFQSFEPNSFATQIVPVVNHLYFPDSKMKLDIFFGILIKREDPLPVDGYCEIEMEARSGENHEYKQIIFTERITMSRDKKYFRLEKDLADLLNVTDGKNHNVSEYFIATRANCVHSPSKISNKRSTWVYFNVRNKYGTFTKAANYRLQRNGGYNDADISIQFRILRKGSRAFPLREEDLVKPVNVRVKLPQTILNNLEYPENGVFQFESISSGGEIKLNLKVNNFTTDMETIINQTVVEIEFDGETIEYAIQSWNQVYMPKIYIYPQDPPTTSYSPGDTAKFNLCSTANLPSGTELNFVVSDEDRIITAGRRNISLTKGFPEVLEISIPEEIQGPAPLVLSVFGKCPNQNAVDKSQNCVFNSSVNFVVNIPKPVITAINLIKDNERNKMDLVLNGVGENTSHISVMLEKVDAGQDIFWKGSYKAPSCPIQYNKEFRSELQDRMEVGSSVRVETESFRNYMYYHVADNGVVHDGGLFEFPNPQIENGSSVSLSLLVDGKLSDGNYSVIVLAVNNIKRQPTALVYSNPTFVQIPPSKISFHIPFFPPRLVVTDKINLTLWIRNPTQNAMNESIRFNYFVKGCENNTTTFSRSVQVQPDSQQTIQLFISPQQTGELLLTVETEKGIRLTKALKVFPVGMDVRVVSKSILTNTNETPTELKNNKPNNSIECQGDPSNGVEIKDYSEDIFRDLYSSFVSGKQSTLWLDTFEKKVHYQIILNLLQTAESSTPSVSGLAYPMEPFVDSDVNGHTLDDYRRFQADETSVFFLENYQYLLQRIKPLTSKGKIIEIGLWLVQKQKSDGSFEPGKCSSATSSSTVCQNETFANTIIGLLALCTAKQISPGNTAISSAYNLALDFKEQIVSTANHEGLKSLDTFELSLLAFFYSTIKHKDAEDVYTTLKQLSLADDDGTHWISKWNSKGNNPLTRNYSLAATAYALMSAVNLENSADAFEIARWLVAQRDENGMYDSLEDTSLVMRSLDSYKKKSKEHLSLAQTTKEVITPYRNISNGVDFTINRSVNESTGIKQIKVCLSDVLDTRVSISLPPRFVFGLENIRISGPHEPRLSHNGNEISFVLPRAISETQSCFDFTPFNLYEEQNSSDLKESKAPGKIRVVANNYVNQEAVKYFFL